MGGTCPILVLHPIEDAHAKGTVSDADYAKRIYDFYVAKFLQNLNGRPPEAKARLMAAGLPVPKDMVSPATSIPRGIISDNRTIGQEIGEGAVVGVGPATYPFNIAGHALGL